MNIDLAELGGRAARKATSDDGVRRFAVDAMTGKKDKQGNFISRVWNGFARFAGSLISKVAQSLFNGLAWTFSTLWGLIVSHVQFVWNFNWNLSDEEANKQAEQLINGLAGSLGTTLGNAFGWLACGALPGVAIFAFNEPMGLYVLKEVGEEALEEIAGNVAGLIRQTLISSSHAFFTWAYANVRKLWRKPNSVFRRELEAGGQMKKEDIDKAVADRSKPWSLALTYENWLESINNKWLRTFIENFGEEAADACIEAGYVVASSVDSYLMQQKVANEGLLGKERTVEILLDRQLDRADGKA